MELAAKFSATQGKVDSSTERNHSIGGITPEVVENKRYEELASAGNARACESLTSGANLSGQLNHRSLENTEEAGAIIGPENLLARGGEQRSSVFDLCFAEELCRVRANRREDFQDAGGRFKIRRRRRKRPRVVEAPPSPAAFLSRVATRALQWPNGNQHVD